MDALDDDRDHLRRTEPDPSTFDLGYGFRRRCGWCGVVLRAWQLNLCRCCRFHAEYSPSSPCTHSGRWHAEPDRLFKRRLRELVPLHSLWRHRARRLDSPGVSRPENVHSGQVREPDQAGPD